MDLEFYFNEWAFLARTSPAMFEQRRRQAISAFLDRSGVHRKRLEALQAKIDEQREQAATPEQAVIVISQLMCASLSDLSREMGKLLKDLNALNDHPAVRAAELAQRGRLAA